jgi:hypothetical protein
MRGITLTKEHKAILAPERRRIGGVAFRFRV